MIFVDVNLGTSMQRFRATRSRLLTGEIHREHPHLQMLGDLMYLTTEHQASVVLTVSVTCWTARIFWWGVRFHIEQACITDIRSIDGQAGRPIFIHSKLAVSHGIHRNYLFQTLSGERSPSDDLRSKMVNEFGLDPWDYAPIRKACA